MQSSRRRRRRDVDTGLRIVAGQEAAQHPISFRTLVEQSLSLILVTDRTGKIEYVNPQFSAVTGFSESELAGRVIHELGDLDQQTLIDLWNTLGFGLPWRGEFEAKKKDGESFWVFAEADPVKDEAGNVTHFVAVGQDITERKRAEDALRGSEETFRRLAEALPAMTFIVQGARARFLSSSAEAILGYTVEELMAMDFWDPVHPDFKEIVRARGFASQRGETVPEPYEVKLVTKSGEERWGLAAVSPIEFDGAPAVVGCVFDITEARNTAEALRERDVQLRIMTEQMPSVVWTADRDLVLTDIAGAGLAPVGVDLREYLGRNILAEYPPDAADTTLRDAHVAALGGSSSSYEINVRGVWFDARVEPLRAPDGEIIGCVGVAFDITARKDAEKALSESEQKFRTLVDSLPAAAFIFQGNRLRYANRTCYDVLGYTDEDLANLNFWDVVHPDYRDLVRERGLARLRGEQVESSYELRFLKKGGEPRWGLFSGAFITYEGMPAVMGVVYDITERKEAEQALTESEQKFRTLVDTMPAAAFIFQGTRLRYANHTWYDILGYSDEDLANFTFWDILHPDYRDLVRDRGLARLRGEDVPSTYEVRFLKKTGEPRWGIYSGAVITYEDAPAVLGIVFDITERKAAEEALNRSEERYRLLYHDNPSMYFTLSDGLSILSVNRHGAEQLGYAAADLVGQPVLTIVHADDQARVRRHLEALARHRGAAHELEFRTLRKDGQAIWVRVSAGVARDVDGRDIVLVVCEDISERKRMEEELQNLREDIERKAERAIVSRVSPYSLTFRELTVLDLVAGGRSDKEIAVILGIRRQTVSKHVANILKKMDASSRTEAGVRALREGFIS